MYLLAHRLGTNHYSNCSKNVHLLWFVFYPAIDGLTLGDLRGNSSDKYGKQYTLVSQDDSIFCVLP